jgi:hypothetical protein
VSLRRTAGGLFDPAHRPLYFSAGLAPTYPRHLLLAANDLMNDAGERLLVGLLDAGHRVLLDSGVFVLTNAYRRTQEGMTFYQALTLPPEIIPGFARLYERYVYLASTYGPRLWGYVELDQGGRDAKRRMRARLEGDGLAPIPVYHPLSDGWAYFDELAERYDRLCFANVSLSTRPVRVRFLHTMWERRRLYPDLWVHMLGLTANEWCLPLPADSCDSSSWLRGLRFPDASIAYASMRLLGDLGPSFRYDRDTPAHPTRGRNAAAALYAESAQQINDSWRVALDCAAGLGADPYPPHRPQEGPVVPAAAAYRQEGNP